jgi:hypothetical protein
LRGAVRRRLNMSTVSIYRLSIWLPILVPAIVILVAKMLGLPLAQGLLWEMLAYSLLYGGLPYAVLAMWATWWVGRHSEVEIRRLMVRAPLLMGSIFVSLTLIIGFAVDAPGPFAAVAVLGLLSILVLGYGYVGLAVLLRRSLGPRQVT